MERGAVSRLPRSSELGAPALGLLECRFRVREDLLMTSDVASEIDRQCSQTEADLQGLKRKLGSSIVSWSSRSIHARASVNDITHSLEDLCLFSSKYGDRSPGARKIQKIFAQDLPFIVKELNRIKAVREYADSALKLEALIGDLEDAVFSSLNPHIGKDSSGKNIYVLKAVDTINTVEDLMLTISNSHPDWRRLLKTVDSRIDKILSKLRPQILADHRSLLASLGWPPKVLMSKIPNPLLLMQRDKKEKYSQSFLELCALQHVQKRKDDSYVRLWAIDELVSPIASRMEHHFSKWIDQPELIFILVHKIINDFIEGIDDVLQPLIDRARLINCSAKEAWVSSMVHTLSDFLVRKIFPVLAASYKDKHLKEGAISDWLHLIDNIIAFDKRVKLIFATESYLYHVETISVLSLFHDRPDWLSIWAKVEVKDAWKKTKYELKQDRAWFSPNGEIYSPPIAEFAVKMVWNMIERCQNLPAVSSRVKFIRSGPVKILRHFFNVLQLRFEKTGYDSEGAILRVCQLINVARFCESKLQEWSDDVKFLELVFSEEMSFFDEEIRSLGEMQINWLSEVVAQVLRGFESCSNKYLERFDEALDRLREEFVFISENLNEKDFLDFWRSVADGLDLFVFNTVLSCSDGFSEEGVKELESDVRGLFFVFGSLCSRPQAFFPCVGDLLRALEMSRDDARYFMSFAGGDEGRDRKWMVERGILYVSVHQVLMILRNRVFTD